MRAGEEACERRDIGRNGDVRGDRGAPGGLVPLGEAEDGVGSDQEADTRGAALGFLLHHAPEGLPELRARYPAARSRAPQCCNLSLYL